MFDNLKFPDRHRPIFVNWRPTDARHAFSIMDRGGPFVDPDTGQVIVLATVSNEVWSQLVDLPEDAWLAGQPLDAEPEPAPDFTAAAKAAWQLAAA